MATARGAGQDARHDPASPPLLTIELCRSDDRFNLSLAQHAQGRATAEPRIWTDEPGHLRPGTEGVERCQRLFKSGDRSVLAESPHRVEVASPPHRQPDKLACPASPIDGLPCEAKHGRRFLDWNSTSLCMQQE